MRIKLLVLAILGLLLLVKISISQQAVEIIITADILNDTGQNVSVNLYLSFYLSNSTPLQRYPIELNISSENITYMLSTFTDENGKFYYRMDNLPPAFYQVVASTVYEDAKYSKSFQFKIEIPRFYITTDKDKYKINESVQIQITGPPNQTFILSISNEDSITSYMLTTDSNGSKIFTTSFEKHGNYTATVHDVKTMFEVLREKEEANLDILIEEDQILGIPIKFLVNGTPNTPFILEVIHETGVPVFSLSGSTSIEGLAIGEFEVLEKGNYSVKVKWGDKSLIKYFFVEKPKIQKFEIRISKREFMINETLNFTIIGAPNTNFLLKLSSEKLDAIFNLTTDESGISEFYYKPILDGNFTVAILLNESNIAEEWFYVKKQVEFISIIKIEQGKAILGVPVRWNSTFLIKNNGEEEIFVNLSSFELPPMAKFISLVENDNIISVEPDFSLKIEPNSSKIVVLQYETPAAFKVESEVYKKDGRWWKEVFVSSNSTLEYYNVSLTIKVPSTKSVKIFLGEIEITNNETYEIKLGYGEISLKIPSLKNVTFKILGVEDENESAAISVENEENREIDCNGNIIEGFTEKFSYGILISNSKNVTIKNCIIYGFEIGIFVKNSQQISLINNTIENNEQGVVFFNSSQTLIVENTAENNIYHGVLLYQTTDNIFYSNRIRNNFDKNILEKLSKIADGIS